jgi:hypothetical protein
VQAAGIGLLVACGLLTWRGVRRQPIAVSSTNLVVLAWAGAALALVSWLAAAGTAAVALIAGIRIQPRA